MNLIELANMDATRNVFHIRFQESSLASAFLFYHEDRKLLVTAAHVLPGTTINSVYELEIFHRKEWKKFDVKILNVGDQDDSHNDIVILDIQDFSNNIPDPRFHFCMNLKKNKIFDAKEVYFLGFPLGLSSRSPNLYDLDEINGGFPMPFLKKGIISNFGCLNRTITLFYLDAIINKGFSGGPAFFVDQDEIILLGVITHFETDPISGNSGIGGGIRIDRVLELINAAHD